MDVETIIGILWLKWSTEGTCASCGWHDSLSGYDLPDDMEIHKEKGYVWLPCHNPEREGKHRGVRVYL